MVQTYQSPVRVYKYPFELVMVAYARRFPTCPEIPIFVSSEIVYEYHSDDNAVEVVERKCALNIEAPYILKKITGVDFVYFTQRNSLDLRKRVLNINATNVSFATRLGIDENCCYYVHPENDQWTCFEQNASLDVKSFFGFESVVEKLAVRQYAANLQKGKEIIEHYVAAVLAEGTTVPAPLSPRPTPPDSPADSAIDVSKPVFGVGSVNDESEDDDDVGTYRERRNTIVKRQLSPQRSADDVDAKLEADYIHRFLGELSALEESRLCQLKYSLRSPHKAKLPNDAHLLRFLRAREFDVGKARDMVTKSMSWRKQHNVDKILSTYEPPACIVQFLPGCWHHHDLENRPVYVLRLGQLDIKGLIRSVGVEGVIKFALWICEQGLAKTAEATRISGKPVSAWSLLVDLEGLSMRHLWRPGVSALLNIMEIVEANYPETMGLMLITRAPRLFPVLWTLIGPLIDENTRNKFMVHGGADPPRDVLNQYIDEQYLPEFIGGRCFCLAPDGGLVPKSLYLPIDSCQTAADAADVLQGDYTLASAFRGLPLEVAVPVAQRGCVLTWDFDVRRGACEFTVLRCAALLPAAVTATAVGASAGGALSPVEKLSAAMGGVAESPSTPLAFDRALRLGHDVFVEEPPTAFTEGDSMQGTHVCSKTGTYVLQWRQTGAAHHHHDGAFDFTLSHKCKVMYYYELLDSANFKGSMASLESCHSSFSSLSLSNMTTQLPMRSLSSSGTPAQPGCSGASK